MDKTALWLPVFGDHNSEVVDAPDELDQMYKDSGKWGGSSLFKDVTFIGYDSTT